MPIPGFVRTASYKSSTQFISPYWQRGDWSFSVLYGPNFITFTTSSLLMKKIRIHLYGVAQAVTGQLANRKRCSIRRLRPWTVPECKTSHSFTGTNLSNESGSGSSFLHFPYIIKVGKVYRMCGVMTLLSLWPKLSLITGGPQYNTSNHR